MDGRKWKETFVRGERIELIAMDDPRAPASGTRGTVTGVDDAGHILVRWDDGSRLNVIWGVDEIRKVCQKCGKSYKGYPAMSRIDDGKICSECGMREAIEAWITR